MDSRKTNSSVNVKFCSQDKCVQNTEYFCHDCQKDFCLKCHKEHATHLDTKHHIITLYRNKGSHFPNKNETCLIHLNSIYQTFCESCNIPICGKCQGHKRHKKLGLLTAYEIKKKQVKKQVFKIRSDTIYQCQVVLKELKGDVKHYREEKKHLELAMDVMSRRIKRFMDEVLSDNSYLKTVHRCLSQEERIQRHVKKIQYYEQIHERLIKRPVKFLQFVKKLRPPSVEDTPNLHLHSLLSMTPDINVEDLIKPLIKIKITEKGKRHIENKQQLKVIYPDDIYAIDTYVVAGVDHCSHISCVTPDSVWINDLNSLILADIKTGVTLKRLPIVPAVNLGIFGLHSVNSECDLIYIENYSTIKKYCNDMTTKTVLKMKKRRKSDWIPLCLCCCQSTDDLLIVKMNFNTKESKVARYNKQGKLTQTIQNDKDGQALYSLPRFITENNNGDVVVSNQIDKFHGAVVVTDRDGRHRFSYKGHSPGLKMLPLGICIDAFSNILVCDIRTYNVHMIEENGRFYRSWVHGSGEMPEPPMSLTYDSNTHRLWVGSPNKNEVYAIRYIHRHPHLTVSHNMDFRKINSSVSVKFCSKDKCLQNVEYICQNCQKDFCLKCHKEHATNLDTKHHSITLYRNKGSHSPNKNETCSIHLDSIYQMYCEFCNIPICGKCKGHRRHKKLGLLTAYKIKQKQVKEQIFNIRSDTIYQCQVLLKEIKGDVKPCRIEKKNLEYSIDAKSSRTKSSMDEVLCDNSYLKNVHQCLSQVDRIQRHVNKIQYYEQLHERLVKRPVKFLQFIKKLRPPSVEDTPILHLHSLLSMTPDINVKDLMNPFTKIKILKKGKRQIENKKLLNIELPVLKIGSYIVRGVSRCHHISCVTPDQVWVNDGNSLILSDTTTGVSLKRFPILPNACPGLHSVNSECELIYIKTLSTIEKLCNDKTTKTVLKVKKRRKSEWFPVCLYCSPSTDDLLIGKRRLDTKESKITRYNKLGTLTQTIQNDKKGQALYKFPRCITENNNGDVVVSDIIDESHGAVVVTDRNGRHRFSYTENPLVSGFLPLGICTDTFSNILVCDFKSGSVHVIQENGQPGGIWRHILNQLGSTLTPMSLSYDVKTHLLWVGSLEDNVVYAFRYIYRHPHLSDKIDLFDELDTSQDQQTK
ncbi:uncharacterized protein LOC144621285 [Crassostrea virginica]